jgi:surfeit locus 1 family protein
VRALTVIVVALVTAAVCVRLGIWQLDRLEQRRAYNRVFEERLAMLPVELVVDRWDDSLRFRRATVAGVFDFERQVVLVARSRNGIPGVDVVTPLLIGDTGAVLVDRGWVPSPDARSVDLESLGEPDTTTAIGVLMAVEERSHPRNGWPLYLRRANPADLQSSYPYRLAPLVLWRLERPTAAADELREIQIPELSNGPHLSYAIQWFSFATIAIVGSLFFLRSARRG